ncbi:MAG: alpha/beta hydrolase [Ruminococcus sp.]|nr:alpha/beta hydrolase [Ruminococcus sp.]
MKIFEFGDQSKDKLLLIHGFQQPWQVWNAYIDHFKCNYHVIVPVLSGHDPDQKEDFISFDADAKAIEEYIIPLYGREIYAVYGMSMGGVLAATLWQNQNLRFDKVIFDGSPLVSMNGFTKSFMLKFYLNITRKTQQRDQKTVEQATKSIVTTDQLDSFLKVMDNMSDATVENCINSIAAFSLKSDIDTPRTTPVIFYGTAANESLAKKSAKFLKKNYPNAVLQCFKGKAHCENSIYHPNVMIAELERIL